MRVAQEGHFVSFDSTSLFYRTWSPTDASSKKALIVVHRGHEHSGRLNDIVTGLNLPDYWAFGYDARGHGQSPGPRGYAEDFSFLTRDLDTFVKFISEKHGIPAENMILVANSVGAVVGASWVHDYAPRIRGMVLAAPALRVKLYVPLALPGLRALNSIKRPAFISSYVKSRMLTHDKDEARRYNEDKLITRDIAVNILIGLFDAGTRLLENASAITTPTLILSAGKDFVVELGAQKKFFAGLGSAVKRMKVFENFYHGVFYEKGKEEGFAMAREFILEAMARPLDRTNLLTAHKAGPSKAVYETLTAKPGLLKAMFFGFQKLSMATMGRVSQGIRVGLATGFDSGLSLDYVYENKARGATFFGRLVDFFYLNAVGWRGIRLRKINLENAIEGAMKNVAARGEDIRILDIAGGAGRYILDVVDRNREKDIRVVICDNVEGNLAQGRALAKNLGLHNVTYQQVDAFGTEGVPGFKPNIIVISGLFELFSDNDLIRRAVSRLAKEAGEGATLIYTGQPYHPQQEMIARTLNNRDGQPWVMRLRSQAELDEIFRCHGFDKTGMTIDPFGIFTVSTATRRPQIAVQITRAASRDNEATM